MKLDEVEACVCVCVYFNMVKCHERVWFMGLENYMLE